MDEKLIARFWSNVDKSGPIVRPDLGPCWLWTRAKNDRGYGVAWDGSCTQLAHRLAWFIERGSWPDNCACHSCDTPACCRPAHLFDGTRADNHHDCRSKGRAVNPPLDTTFGEDHSVAKLTEAQAAEIIRRGFAGEFARVLAAEFGVTVSNVSAILRGRSWIHLERPPSRVLNQRRVSPEVVAMIKASPKSGVALSRELGLPTSTISVIRNR